MTAQAIQNPLPTFTGLDGLPLSGGYVYFGLANQDPRQYPASVFFDAALTIPVTQPLRTTAGYLYRNGGPTSVWTDSGYHSLLVLDSAGRQVSYCASVLGSYDTTLQQSAVDRFSGDGVKVAFTLSVTPSSENETDVHVAGVYVQKNAYSVVGSTLTFATPPASGTDNVEVVTHTTLDYTAVSAEISSAAASAASVARIYPGTYAADPTTRPDGSAIQAGDRYVNSVDSFEYIYINGAWTNAADSATAAAASAAIAVATGRRRAILFITYGQSNGVVQPPAYSTEQVDGLVSFNGGQQPSHFAGYVNSVSLYQDLSNFGSIGPWKEGVLGEGWGTGVGVQLMQLAGVEKVLHFSAASIGLAYYNLAEGTAKWGDLMTALIQGVKLLQAQGYELDDIEPVIQWVQGEAEASALNTLANEYITAAQETAALTSLMASINRGLSIAFGRPTTTSLYLWPVQVTKLNTTGGPNVQEGQLTASNTVGGIVMTTNPCQFTTDMNADLVHFQGYGKRLMAEAHGLIMRKVLNGEAWKPLQIITATRATNVITATFNKNIAIDTTTFAEVSAASFPKQKYGFQFFDDATELTVSSVTVSGKVATITLGSTPAGTVKKLRLSQHQIGAGTVSAVLARSNIRATTAIGTASDGTTIYDFAVPQGITVT